MVEPGMLVASIVPGWDQFVGLIKAGLNFLAEATNSGGLAIVLFTILIKLLLTPLTLKALKSSRAMQDLQPQIRALQKRYGNDRQKLSAETMRLYQTRGVNPMAGCFPVLLQIPIFFGLYQAIVALSQQGAGEFAQPFLWLPSLAAADPWHILPFVAAFFQLIQTRMSMPTGKYKPTDPQQQMMLQIMQFLPLTVIIFGWTFAAGPVIYWATQSVFSAVQQYFITGWGALREWLPFLPEVTRYTPPDPDAVDESKVIVTGADGGRPVSGGLWGLIGRQMEKLEQQRRDAEAAAGDGATAPKPAGNGRPKDRSRIIVNTAGAGSAGAPDDGADSDHAPPGSGEGAGSRKRSRIIVTNTNSSPADGGGNGQAPVAPAGENGTRGPVVPRRNRNRR